MVEILARIPLFKALVLVRDHFFFGFGGCFRVWRDLGQGGGLVGQDWWWRLGVLGILPGIPLVWAVDLVRDRVF